jgi:4'-phosphopantetheinyl transferase
LRLAQVLNADPAELAFDYGEQGKPRLATTHSTGDWQFNVSHSGDTALLAALPGLQVGVDVEVLRPLRDRDGLVRRYFSAAENAAYFALPEPQREAAFFAAWTAKEALVKALGQGLHFPLKDFDVQVSAQGNGALLSLQGVEGARSGWCLANVYFAADLAAAVAVQGSSLQVVAQPS